MSPNNSPIEENGPPDNAIPTSSPTDTSPHLSQHIEKKDASNNPGGFKIEQIFVFVLFIILLIFFSANPLIFSTLTGLLTLLTVGALENVSNKLIEYVGKPFNWLIKPLTWLSGAIFSSATGLRRHRRLIINIFISIILVLTLAMTTLHGLLINSVGNINDYFCLQQSLVPWAACNSGLGTTTLGDGVKIGLIEDNSYGYFDQSSLNAGEKQVDDKIFEDNKTACAAAQHTTLVVVTMLSRTVEDPADDANLGLQDLRGAYLAQHTYNVTKPSNPLCLAIANLGTLDTANKQSQLVNTCSNCYSLQQIIHRLAQFARYDTHFHGIIGFPFSQQATDALQAIETSPQLKSIPVISPSASASTDLLSNSPNFYRMVSPDKSQAKILAQFFCTYLNKNSSLAIFSDSTNNTYSRSLQVAFEDQVNCLPKVLPISYQNGVASSIDTAVATALNVDHATYLFFPGYNSDLDALQLAIHNILRDKASSITIIGGDGLYDLDGTSTHYIYSPVYSTTFASPLSTDGTSSLISTFINNYALQHFPETYLANSIQGDILFPPHVLLTYDATTAFITTLKKMTHANFSQRTFNTNLATIYFSGVSGNVELQGDQDNARSDRNTGDIYVTCTDLLRTIHVITKYQSLNIDTNTASVQEEPLPNKQPLCSA